MELKKLFELAGVDATKGKAKKLVEQDEGPSFIKRTPGSDEDNAETFWCDTNESEFDIAYEASEGAFVWIDGSEQSHVLTARSCEEADREVRQLIANTQRKRV